MKKIVTVFALSLGLGLSGQAMAQLAAFTGSEGVEPGDCALLAESVTLNASSKVHGGWACNEATNVITVGFCHEGGSRSELVCRVVGQDNSTTPPTAIYNNGGCNDGNVGQTLTGVVDYQGFVATSSGGGVGGMLLNGRCTAATIGAISVE